MIRTILIVLFVVVCFQLKAQEPATLFSEEFVEENQNIDSVKVETLEFTNVQIIQDDRVDTLIQKHICLNENTNDLAGYRIQIFFESGNYSKNRANKAIEEFYEKFEDIPAYLSFKEPYYKVRVGDYRTKIDAQRVLQKIIREYPNAIYVKETINPPRID